MRVIVPLLPILLQWTLLLSPVHSAKIFFMIPLTTKSEKQPYYPFIDALGQRGHEVTVASIIQSNYSTPNVKEFTTIEYEDFLMDELFSDPIQVRRNAGKYYSLVMNMDYANNACHKVYANSKFQHAIKQKYDVVITNANFQECFLGALYKMEAPFIMYSSMLPQHFIWELAGVSLPSSFVPLALGPPRPAATTMGLWDRLENVLLDIHLSWNTRFKFLPEGERVYRKYLDGPLPSAHEIKKNVSLILTNTHYTYNVPAPAMPDIIEVGGMHCRPAKPLPKDLHDFVSGAKDGFIYFSMGSVVKSVYFPEDMRRTLISVFSRLKQRVVWKFEDEIQDLPPNVRVSKWLPQQDLLGHPNCKMFMTHGGAMSTYEAIYHGVPLITLPIFIDQNINSKLATDRGYAIELEVLELSEKTVSDAIQAILYNPKYASKAKEMSSAFKDQPQTPVERAVFWTEYVIRHRGTPLLRSIARDLTFVEYYCLDVILLIVTTLTAAVLSLVYALKFLLGLLFPNQDLNRDKKKRK